MAISVEVADHALHVAVKSLPCTDVLFNEAAQELTSPEECWLQDWWQSWLR